MSTTKKYLNTLLCSSILSIVVTILKSLLMIRLFIWQAVGAKALHFFMYRLPCTGAEEASFMQKAIDSFATCRKYLKQFKKKTLLLF